MHAQPIRRPLGRHMTFGAWTLEKICRQAGMAAKQFTQKEIIPFTEWGRDIEVGIHLKL